MKSTRPCRACAVLVTLALSGVSLLAGSVSGRDPPKLRVCADPNNLPFSNDRGEFEKRLATTLAADLVRRRAEIDRVLAEYGVPRADGRAGSAGL